MTFAVALAVVVAAASPGFPASPKQRPHPSYQVVDPPRVMFDAAQPMTLYMNKNGGTFTCPGGLTDPDDATQNKSTIACGAPNGSGTVTPFQGDDAAWQTVFSCIKNLYAPFNLNVVDVQPTSGQYIEAVIGGSPDQVGQPSAV